MNRQARASLPEGMMPMRLHDGIPVVDLPDGCRALIDTGWSWPNVVTHHEVDPIEVGGRRIEAVRGPVDLAAIAAKIGAPRIDAIIGARVLHGGFTIDFEHEAFAFHAVTASSRSERISAIPYSQKGAGGRLPPIISIRVGGQHAAGFFDTGAPYSLWKSTPKSPSPASRVARRDFHVSAAGRLVEFDVVVRSEVLELPGFGRLEAELAYLPESLPASAPELVLGMDVPAAVGCSRLVLNPDAREIELY